MSCLRALALLAVLLLPVAALACTCNWAGPFTKVALRTDLVVLAEVRSHERHRMDVALVDVLKGAERRRVVTVLGGDEASCRPRVSGFPPGTRWILALARMNARDYALSECGEFWLEVRGDRAVGRITMPAYGLRLESAPLADVLAWVRSGGTTRLTPQALSEGVPSEGRHPVDHDRVAASIMIEYHRPSWLDRCRSTWTMQTSTGSRPGRGSADGPSPRPSGPLSGSSRAGRPTTRCSS